MSFVVTDEVLADEQQVAALAARAEVELGYAPNFAMLVDDPDVPAGTRRLVFGSRLTPDA